MARLKRPEVIAELTKLGIEFDAGGKYNALCKLLKAHSQVSPKQDEPTGAGTPNQVCITNRIKKRPTFLGDSVRDQRDQEFLNAEIGKRVYKGKLLRVTTIKEYEVSDDGYWVTEFVIDLKG